MMQRRGIGKDAEFLRYGQLATSAAENSGRPMIHAFFVYGTLKRGQCRAQHWPCEPVSVRAAWTPGTLFSRADYPAMTAGEDRVLGELWTFRPDFAERVIETLDQIEGTNQPGQRDLYRRVTVETWSLDDERLEDAFAYHYASDPVDDGFVQMPTDTRGLVCWPTEA